MIAPIALVTYAVVVNSVGSRLLRGAAWTRRAPALAVALWQALTASVILAGTLAGLALVFPSLPASASVASFLRACTAALRQQYETPAGQALAITGGLLFVGVVGRTAYSVITAFRAIRMSRQVQLQHLAIASSSHPQWPVSVIDHVTAAAYCIPGREPRLVFTSAALAQLTDEQAAAVVAHERAHLRGRHDLVLALFAGLRDAFPFLASTRMAQAEVARLIEMRADDIALQNTDRFTLASALVGLSQAPVPAGAVGATSSALARLHRMATPPKPLQWAAALFVAAVAFALLVAPLVIVAEPAVAAAGMSYCPVDISS